MIKRFYGVKVYDHDGDIVTIESGMLSGRNIGEREEGAIRAAISALCGFLCLSGSPGDESTRKTELIKESMMFGMMRGGWTFEQAWAEWERMRAENLAMSQAETSQPLASEVATAGSREQSAQLVDGYNARFWRDSYGLLSQAVLDHLGGYIHDDDVAEEAIFVEAIEQAGAALKAAGLPSAGESKALESARKRRGVTGSAEPAGDAAAAAGAESTAALTNSADRTTQDRALWIIDNVYTIARREKRRAEDGKPLRPEMWGHVQRLCEQNGAQSRTVGVLRDGDPATVSAPENRALNGWRSIETAPKDGTSVLLLVDGVVRFGAYGNREAQWWIADDGVNDDGEPTHWQSLPPPPDRSPGTSRQEAGRR